MPNEVLDNVGADGPKYNEDLELLKSGEVDSEGSEDKEEVVEEEILEDKELNSKEVEEEVKNLEEEKEDTEKLAVPFNIPTFGEIKAKYPDITKDFPGLRGFFYQAAEYCKLFPSIEDAKEALEDTEAYVSMRESVISGDPSNFIDALKSQSEETLQSFSWNFLVELSKKDNATFVNITTPLYENVLRGMANDRDEDVRNAALKLSEYLFGTTEVAEGKKTFAKRINPPKNDKVDDAAMNSAYQNVAAKVNNSLGTIIASELNDLSSFLRKSIVNSCLEDIWAELAKDPVHMQNMKRRWERAALNGLSDDDKTKIINTLLVRARPLIPSIRTKYRNEALGESKKASDKKIERIESGIKREVSGGRSGNSRESNRDNSEKNDNGKKPNYNKLSDLDILNL